MSNTAGQRYCCRALHAVLDRKGLICRTACTAEKVKKMEGSQFIHGQHRAPYTLLGCIGQASCLSEALCVILKQSCSCCEPSDSESAWCLSTALSPALPSPLTHIVF